MTNSRDGRTGSISNGVGRTSATAFAAVRLILVALTVQAIACSFGTPDHPYWISPEASATHKTGTYFLAPLNALGPVDPKLQPGRDRVFEELRTYLGSVGVVTVVSIPAEDYRLSAHRVGVSQRSQDRAHLRALFAQLREDTAFDLIVIPDLVIKYTDLTKGILEWDGVVRGAGPGSGYRWIAGSTAVASLHVRIYDGSANLLFHGFGGLDKLLEPDFVAERMEPIAEPLSNRSYLQEGVAIALHPYFPLSR